MRLAKERLRNLMPRLLRQERAATYTDTCVPTFLGLVKAKVLPPPKQLSKNIEAWDRDELDPTMIAYLSAVLVLQTRPGTTESAA